MLYKIGVSAPNYIILVIGLSFVVASIDIVKKYHDYNVDIRKQYLDVNGMLRIKLSTYIYIFLIVTGILIALTFINILFDLQGLEDPIHLLIKLALLTSSLLFFIVPFEYHKRYKETLAVDDINMQV